MPIKIIVCFAILAFTTSVGYLFATKFRNRRLFFSQFKLFNERFLSEIEFSKRPIKEFVQLYAYKGDFNDILRIYLENLGKYTDFSVVFPEIIYLEKEDARMVCDYFDSLGKGDSSTQKSNYLGFSTRLYESYQKSELEYKKYANLYVKLGVLIGLAIIIVII